DKALANGDSKDKSGQACGNIENTQINTKINMKINTQINMKINTNKHRCIRYVKGLHLCCFVYIIYLTYPIYSTYPMSLEI
ncbi:MAG: hypothetical protein RR846_05795, partial [Oscillospiraceae bacterium]